MKRKTKLCVTTAAIVVIVLSVLVPAMSGTANAQETGEDSATIDYDYNNEEISYEIGTAPGSEFDIQEIPGPASTSFEGPVTATGTIRWGDNGNVLFIAEEDAIFQYTAETPYNYNSLSIAGSATLTSSNNGVNDFQVGNNGQSIYYIQSNTPETIHQMNLGTAYDINTIQSTESTSTFLGVTYTAFDFAEDGSFIYIAQGNRVQTIPLSTNWDITSANIPRSSQNAPWINSAQTLNIINETTVAFSEANGQNVSIARHTTNDWNDAYVTERRNVGTHSGIDLHTESPRFDVVTSTGVEIGVNQYRYEYGAYFTDSDGTTVISSEGVGLLDSSGTIPFTSNEYIDGLQMHWNVVGTDVSGTSNPISIYGEGELSIRNEQTNELITESVNVTAYGEDSGIYSLDTSSGSIDITGLPDQSYTFVVSADGYTQRVKYVDQLGSVPDLYLLDNETETVTSQFQLEDRTGTYNQDSRIIIRRSINGSWETIISDSFGSSGITAELQEGIRYRLYIETNEQMQLIGPYTASISESVTVSPTSGEIDIGEGEYWSAGASYSDQEVNARFVDPTGETDTVSVTVYERGNESNTLVTDDTYSNPSELQLAYAVPDQYNESNWIVELEITRGSETYTTTFNVGPTANIVPSELDDFWRKVVAISLMLCFGMVFSVANKAVGSIVYACIGGMFYWIGLLEGLTTAALVTAYFFIVIIYNIYMKS